MERFLEQKATHGDHDGNKPLTVEMETNPTAVEMIKSPPMINTNWMAPMEGENAIFISGSPKEGLENPVLRIPGAPDSPYEGLKPNGGEAYGVSTMHPVVIKSPVRDISQGPPKAVGVKAFEESESSQVKSIFMKKLRKILNMWEGDEPEENVANIADAMKMERVYSFIFNLAGIVCSCYANEMLWWRRFTLDDVPEEEQIINLLKAVSVLTTVVLAIFLVRYRIQEAEIIRLKSSDESNLNWIGEQGYVSSGTCMDILISMIQPIPYVNRVTVTLPLGLAYQDCTYNIDMALIIIMIMGRLPFLIRFLFSRSMFWRKRALFRPNFSLVDPSNYSVFYRYYHHLYPVQLHLGTVFFYLFSFGYLFFIFERVALDWPETKLWIDDWRRRETVIEAGILATSQPYCNTNNTACDCNLTNLTNSTWYSTCMVSHQTRRRRITAVSDLPTNLTSAAGDINPEYGIDYWNQVWVVAVSAGTVGLGEHLSHTFIGRGLVVITVMFGTGYVGLLVSAVDDAMSLNHEEDAAMSAIEDHKRSIELEYRAATLIQRVWHLNQEAAHEGYSGDAKARYMYLYLDGDVEVWKTFRKEHLVFQCEQMTLKRMVTKLCTRAERSAARQASITEATHNICDRQDALQERQDKVTHELAALGSKLGALAQFLDKMAPDN